MFLVYTSTEVYYLTFAKAQFGTNTSSLRPLGVKEPSAHDSTVDALAKAADASRKDQLRTPVMSEACSTVADSSPASSA